MSKAIFKYREARAGERGLFAVDEEGLEILGALKLQREVRCEIRRSRNPKHHKLFFAILKFVQMHCPLFEHRSIDDIKDAVKLATGLATLRIDHETGRRYYVLRSMSWAAMDQVRFNRFFNDACEAIAQRWMPPGTTPEDVRTELFKMIEGPYQLQNLPTTKDREPRREAWLREPMATVGVTRESKGYRGDDPCSQGSRDPTSSMFQDKVPA